VIASEHELRDWASATSRGDERVDRVFEAAVDAIVQGDLETLVALLHEHPDLARRRSVFGHGCTLLHHVAANGVEQSSQRSPANAPAIAQAILDAGADPDAGSLSYGGPDATTLELLVSSCHPAEAGVQADLVEVLCRAGAKLEGLRGDGSPLWTAITWGYDESAQRLVKCGARVDNVITAAALGLIDQVRSYFGADGRLVPGEIRGAMCFSHGRPFDAAHVLEYAFICAASAGHRDVVELLLTKGPDLRVREPVYGNTALDAASYPHPAARHPEGQPEIVRLLEELGAVRADVVPRPGGPS
jgi:ankyrin repeat protein